MLQKTLIELVLVYASKLLNSSFTGIIDEIILEAKLTQVQSDSVEQSKTHINGLSNYKVEMQQHIKLLASGMCELSEHGAETDVPVQEIDFINFPPSSVIAFK